MQYPIVSIRNETQLVKYLQSPNSEALKGLRKPQFNYAIKGYFSAGLIGYADLVFSRYSVFYVVEIKYGSCTGQDFWESLKVLGYVEAIKMTENRKKVVPVILLHKSVLDADKLAIVGKLNLKYITFCVVNGTPIFERFL